MPADTPRARRGFVVDFARILGCLWDVFWGSFLYLFANVFRLIFGRLPESHVCRFGGILEGFWEAC